MDKEALSEKSSVTTVPTTTEDYKRNKDVDSARTTVLVLLGIQLFAAFFSFIAELVALIKYYTASSATREPTLADSDIGSFIGTAVLMIYIIAFIIVVAKYLRVGILIFAVVGLLVLIGILIFIILLIIAIIGVAAVINVAGVGVVVSIIIFVIAGIVCILKILTVAFSFKLAKLIKTYQSYQYV